MAHLEPEEDKENFISELVKEIEAAICFPQLSRRKTDTCHKKILESLSSLASFNGRLGFNRIFGKK